MVVASMTRPMNSSAGGDSAANWYSSSTSHVPSGQPARSSLTISASTSTSSSGRFVTLSRWRMRLSQPGRSSDPVFAMPAASAATSADAGPPTYQTAGRSGVPVHWRASVVFP